VVRAQSRLPVAAFERAAIGGAFEVATNGVSDMNSIIPPARINDFRRGEMGSDRVELLWTAVGASMMDGTGTYDCNLITIYNLLSHMYAIYSSDSGKRLLCTNVSD
jgi:hypothetical protein